MLCVYKAIWGNSGGFILLGVSIIDDTFNIRINEMFNSNIVIRVY